MAPLPHNQFMPEGQFEGITNYKDSYLPNHAQR